MSSSLSPVVTQLAVGFAGEMLNLAIVQDEVARLKLIQPDLMTDEEEDDLDRMSVEANCFAESTAVLKNCFLAMYPQFMSDPVEVYKWALGSFNSPDLNEDEERALTSLQISAKDDLGDYRTEIEKLPPFDVAMVETAPQEDEDPNLRGKLRQRGRDFKDSPFMHRQERRLHAIQRGVQKIPRAIRGAFARIKGGLHKVKTNIQDRPHYRVVIVKQD